MSGARKQKHVRCAVPSCQDNQRSLYNLPKDEATRREWLDFMAACDAPHGFRPHMLVCRRHFGSWCFANEAQYNAGFASKLLLLPGAVPTIADLRGTGPTEHAQSTSSTSPLPLPASRRVSCQTDPVGCRSTGTQLSQRTLRPNFRSIGTQTIPSIGPYLTSAPSKAMIPAKKPRVLKEETEERSIDVPEPQDSSNNAAASGTSLTSPPSSS